MNEYSRKPSLDLMLSLITLGFYDYYLMYKTSSDITDLKYFDDKRESASDKIINGKRRAFILPAIAFALNIFLIIFWIKRSGNSFYMFYIEPLAGVVILGILFAIAHIRNFSVLKNNCKVTGAYAASVICSFFGLRIVGFMLCDKHLNRIAQSRNNSDI